MTSRQTKPNEKDVGQLNIRDMIQQLTGGRPYLFVVMAYGKRWDLFERISRIANRELNVACIRADDVKSSGYDLLAKIHLLISRAELVIAEISEHSPNVFYEIGYAVALQKAPLLLLEKGCQVPIDLKGLEVLEYKTDKEGTRAFETGFTNQLSLRMNSDFALLRDMLEAPIPQPAYIVSSPKYAGKENRTWGQVYDARTFGDHLGILGLISAFGSIRGEGKGIELISAQHTPPDLLEQDLSLYLIGSKKINSASGKMLNLLQKSRDPDWFLGPAPGYTEKDEDYHVVLYRSRAGKFFKIQGKMQEFKSGQKKVWVEDYGIIVRGPHPRHPGRLVLITAGAHSLGTGAACLAATRSILIQKIRSKLPEGVLEDKASTFWVLVKGKANSKDGLLDLEDVSIEEAGVYEKSN